MCTTIQYRQVSVLRCWIDTIAGGQEIMIKGVTSQKEQQFWMDVMDDEDGTVQRSGFAIHFRMILQRRFDDTQRAGGTGCTRPDRRVQ